jgi:hypothetical protein
MKLIILKIEANHHSEYITTRTSKEIFLKIETNRHRFSKRRRSKTTLKRSNPSEKTLLRSESKNRYENRNTNEEKLPPEEADDKETMLKTNQILQEKMPNKELKQRDNSQNR